MSELKRKLFTVDVTREVAYRVRVEVEARTEEEARVIGKLDAAEIPDEEWSHAGTAREWTNVREEKSSPVLGDE